MGYELHIVRKEDWNNFEEESNITLDEWLRYISVDDELELSNGYPINFNGIESFHTVPGFCNWHGHSTNKGDIAPWLDYGYGSITTKHPDDETIRKMILIAEKLQAKVQGDEGEFYDEDYFLTGKPKFLYEERKKEISSEERKEEVSNGKIVSTKPWWRFW